MLDPRLCLLHCTFVLAFRFTLSDSGHVIYVNNLALRSADISTLERSIKSSLAAYPDMMWVFQCSAYHRIPCLLRQSQLTLNRGDFIWHHRDHKFSNQS
jgi:hypothetical protein